MPSLRVIQVATCYSSLPFPSPRPLHWEGAEGGYGPEEEGQGGQGASHQEGWAESSTPGRSWSQTLGMEGRGRWVRQCVPGWAQPEGNGSRPSPGRTVSGQTCPRGGGLALWVPGRGEGAALRAREMGTGRSSPHTLSSPALPSRRQRAGGHGSGGGRAGRGGGGAAALASPAPPARSQRERSLRQRRGAGAERGEPSWSAARRAD